LYFRKRPKRNPEAKRYYKLKVWRERREELFALCSPDVHRLAARINDLDELKAIARKVVHRINQERLRIKMYVPMDAAHEVADKLAEGALAWKNKKIAEGKLKIKNFGAMGFPKIPYTPYFTLVFAETKRRQKESAKRTNALRREKAEKKIFAAIKECEEKNIKITKTLIAKMTGIQREELSRRYKGCFLETAF